MYAQQSPITIQWTAMANGKWHPLDRVVITNKSNGDTMTVYYPDTVFECYSVGIKELPVTSYGLRVYPNPFSNTAQVEFSLAQYGEADLTVYDLLGREIVRQSFVLESGTHSVNVSLPNGMYLLSLQTTDGKCTARLLSEGKGKVAPKITSPQRHCEGDSPKQSRNTTNGLLHSVRNDEKKGGNDEKATVTERSRSKSNTNFQCQYGDTLVLQGFIPVCDTFLVEEHIVSLTKDTLIVFVVPQPTPITPVLIGKGNLHGWGGEDIPMQNLVITTSTEWNTLMNSINTIDNITDSFTDTIVNFDSCHLIAVFDEIHSKEGWNIDVSNIMEYDNMIIVTVEYSYLATGNDTIVIAQPYHIVKTPATEKEIKFCVQRNNIDSLPYKRCCKKGIPCLGCPDNLRGNVYLFIDSIPYALRNQIRSESGMPDTIRWIVYNSQTEYTKIFAEKFYVNINDTDGIMLDGRICNFPDFAKEWTNGSKVYMEGIDHFYGNCRGCRLTNICIDYVLTRFERR